MKKKLVFIFLVTISIISLTGCSKRENESNINIITTNFPGYDFARAITKNASNINVKMLLKPGSESHDYEPTPKDIINIKKSDMFIYIGGDSDVWIDNVLNDIDKSRTKIIKLMDLVNLREEEIIEGMEKEDDVEKEYDEHVWTSPINAITIINKLKKEIIKLDKQNKTLYESNTNNYINELKNIDEEFRNIVSNSKRKEIIFADRFPLRYFADEYNLTYYAAFPGCSEQTEASAKTITFLINKVKEDDIPIIFHIEMSNEKIADRVAEETNAKILEFSSAHNISQEDFDNGITYIDIMKKNIISLKEALN